MTKPARTDLAQRFIETTDWATAKRRPLAGDASNRRYERLISETAGPAVLMDAPAERGEDVRPFIKVAEFLTSLGLSAPRILAQDIDAGFLLLEDLGDALFARLLTGAPELEPEVYAAATDALIALHQSTPPKLETYDAHLMTEYASLAFTRYAHGTGQHPGATVLSEFSDAFRDLLGDVTQHPAVLIQRDYHAENLLWLPDRTDLARVGMLDFQDAMMGHPAYDLVSVLQDARRDVPVDIEQAMTDRYINTTGIDRDTFLTAFAALGVQRNMRILGVFARLSLDHGKTQYVRYIPRVWGLLQRDLAHPALAEIKSMIDIALPEPSASALERLCQA